ncbi:HAD family hydrolase [Galbibacter mesophilus]|uniref:HAD family hydrolase n=1 Tax=Galbibacter mesophilus TaxID=379069 RepID=UPI00191DCF0E|nr:HAD family phosphatase [Galbibacter mesophilus]MCM5663786.1 HAD family phosphatase [Galbibacter mesophilus]
MKKPIKNIIFDFGDVFIDLDKPATTSAILEKYPDFILTEEMIRLNENYEIGAITSLDFINGYQQFLPKETTESIEKIWNSIILNFPPHRMEFIEKLAKENNFRLFLLSNTNALHIEQVIKNISKDRYDRFKNCFEKFYLSHEINLRKPNADIFEFVLNENNLKAEETLFVDDTAEHIATARKLGLHTWNLTPENEDVTELFQKDLLF